MSQGVEEEEAGPMLAPVATAARIGAMDVLRGFALLGILVINIQDFASPESLPHDVASQVGPHHVVDTIVITIQWMFFKGKMRALFSALFGAGTVLLLERIEHRRGAARAADIFHRRNMWLMFFGLIHGVLLWSGDILLLYSVAALLFLYPLRNLSARTLICTGLMISLVGGTLGRANVAHVARVWPQAALQQGAYEARLLHRPLTEAQAEAEAQVIAKRRAKLAALPAAIAEGRVSYAAGFKANAQAEVDFWTLIVTSGAIFESIGSLIAGMGLFKWGFFSARRSARAYASIAVFGYAICWSLVLTSLDHVRRLGFSDAALAVWMAPPYGVEQIAGAMANASVLLLIVRAGVFRPAQRALAAVGRMAFSNYILTTLICQFVFRWGPWKLYGALEYYQQIYVVLIVWAVNLVFSGLWLRVFAFGPLEWMWRSLTYWRPQPILEPRMAPA